MFDYHMHSAFSADCNIPMEEMIEAAIQKGLTEICFTDHIDYEYPDDTIVFDFDQKEYDAKIKNMQQQFADRIRIKKGVEIGVQPHLLDQYETLMEKGQFDFVICSIHTADRKEMHFGEFFKGRSIEEAYALYYEELFACVKKYKQYSVLGHIDLVKRYRKQDFEYLFHEELREIFKVIIADGKGIELNTSGVRYNMPSGMPSDDILKLYKECGGEILTLGSDAHKPQDIAFQFQESLELFQSIGFKYIATFDRMEPTFHAIDELL
ncbi:histidinol-phosphatase [Sporosarcina sp. HYO08]|nr:histidinol-phosphatase HisJ family protein [Sporosarcina sp. HYO08]KXH87087.1 histidinol-phosphatase [Sporosarcina sp. HYO08]